MVRCKCCSINVDKLKLYDLCDRCFDVVFKLKHSKYYHDKKDDLVYFINEMNHNKDAEVRLKIRDSLINMHNELEKEYIERKDNKIKELLNKYGIEEKEKVSVLPKEKDKELEELKKERSDEIRRMEYEEKLEE